MSAYLEGKTTTDTEELLPWLVFKLNDLTYTINSRIVTSIVQLDDTVTPVASAPEIFRGVLNYRGDIIPLLDMRKLFGMSTITEERDAFNSFIEAKKQEQVDFVNELDYCVKNNSTFTKPLDPHLSKLGRWCDNIKSEKTVSSQFVKRNLDEIKKPLGTLYELAKELLDSKDSDIRAKKLNEIRKSEQIILELLDGMVTAYNDNYREMAVIASDDMVKLGLIVDEVVAVDELEILSDSDNFPSFQKTKFFTGIAASTKVKGEVLLVNEPMLMSTFEKYKNAV